MDQRRQLPSVDRLLHQPGIQQLMETAPRNAVVAAVRESLDAARTRRAGPPERWEDDVRERLAQSIGAGLVPVLNATGVVLHTNLGRAPLAHSAVEAMTSVALGYSNLELDLPSGARGSRSDHCRVLLRAITGADDALVVNNAAGALVLALNAVAEGRDVVISRGELIEIGGSFRLPDIMARAGARLIEVGTTNRTRVADFEEVLADGRAKLVLRVHPSNFAQSGFVDSPDSAELAGLAHRHGAIVVDDLGSGALLATERFGLAHEPMPIERLRAGADLVTFSGDKLVGGPQAGIIAGRADLIARLRKDPLARAMRPDKVILAALAATLRLYRGGIAAMQIPVWRQLGAPLEELQRRAGGIAEAAGARAVESEATVGGGSLPGQTLPSWAVAIDGRAPDRLLARLRAGVPAVIGRIVDGAVVLDIRTVEPADDVPLGRAIRIALEDSDARRRS